MEFHFIITVSAMCMNRFRNLQAALGMTVFVKFFGKCLPVGIIHCFSVALW